jgi:hypothetical protein
VELLDLELQRREQGGELLGGCRVLAGDDASRPAIHPAKGDRDRDRADAKEGPLGGRCCLAIWLIRPFDRPILAATAVYDMPSSWASRSMTSLIPLNASRASVGLWV